MGWRRRPCIFPFTTDAYTTAVYNGCIAEPGDREDGWCATKVDNNGKYTADFGMCHENCPTESPSKICATTYRVQALPITIILTIIIKYEIPYHLDISYV